jgi:hypothetical protein
MAEKQRVHMMALPYCQGIWETSNGCRSSFGGNRIGISLSA